MEKQYLLDQLNNILKELKAKESELKHQEEIIEKAIKMLEGK